MLCKFQKIDLETFFERICVQLWCIHTSKNSKYSEYSKKLETKNSN